MKVPAITTTPRTSPTDRPKLRKSSLSIMSSAERPSLRAAPLQPQNPATPVVPRVRTAQRTPIHSSSSSSTSSLHPNVTTRTPNTLTRKTRAESVALPDVPYHARPGSYVASRPSSAASNRSFVSTSNNAAPKRLSQSGSMFFHAGQGGYSAPPTPHIAQVQPTYTASHSSGPKFFHADGAPSTMGNGIVGEPYRLARAPSRNLLSSPQLGANGPVLAPTSNGRSSTNYSPPSSRSGSMVGFPASSPRPSPVVLGNPRIPVLPVAPMMMMPPEPRGQVKFVYADGTEEVIPAAKPASLIGSGPTSPLLPTSPMFSSASNSPAPAKITYPMSPLASPNGTLSSPPPQYFQRHVGHSSSRRSSIDLKAQHRRSASISSVIELSAAVEEEIVEELEEELGSGMGGSGSSMDEHDDDFIEEEDEEDEVEVLDEAAPIIPSPMSAAERIKQMEERSANSRRDRKMMDLEISNASLRAINKTLEREMRKQAAELRRYKRLARAGRLSSAPSISNLISPEDDEEADDAVDIGDETDDTSVADTEGESEFGFDDEEGEDTETEQLSEEEEDEDEDGSEGAIDEKHREADEKRLTWDLSKHQSLLDASSRMNKSLRGCMFLTDQLIREARKALEHKIRPSDIRLGGRILCDEEDYYEPVEAADASAAEEEAEEDELGLQPEEEAVVAAAEEPGVYHHRYFIPPELRPVRHGLL